MYMDGSQGFLLTLIIGLIVGILAFFIVRWISLWYFKINRRVALLEEQNKLLRELIDKMN